MTENCCNIICVQNSHNPILLPHLKPICIGRTSATGIKDLRCSKRQVLATANYETCLVEIIQEGLNASEVDGVYIHKNAKVLARHESIINLWHGDCIHKIIFNFRKDEGFDKKKNQFTDRVNEENSREGLNYGNFRWEEVNRGHLLILTNHLRDNNKKVAAFDMDGTVINTKSGRVFPVDKDDWKILNDKVQPKLKELVKYHYTVVIFTNQGGIGNGKIRTEDFKQKIENIVRFLDIPILVFISTAQDIYRKPAPGMWFYLKHKIGEIDNDNSFFVGDAAGRVANWEIGKKKDFSNTDRLFAMNIGLKFFTPDEYFLGKAEAPYEKVSFNPSEYLTHHKLVDIDLKLSQQQNNEVVIMVGCPGSGKSHFVKHHLIKKGYFPVSRDKLHTWQKCVSLLENKLISKEKVVIDNVNHDIESRSRYIKVAKKYNVPVRCFVMNTTIEHCFHNNKFRELTDTSHEKISSLLLNSYSKSYVPPNIEEGFEDIIYVPFVPIFSSSSDEELYKMFLYAK